MKARLVGEISVSGPDLARSLADLGLIDEYHTSSRSCLVAASRSSPAAGRRFALWRAIRLAMA